MDSTSLRILLTANPFKNVASAKPNDPVTQFLTCPVRVQFSHLSDGRADQQGKIKFDCVLIVPPEADLTIPKERFVSAASQKWGAGWAGMSLKSPVKDQKNLAGKYPGFSDAAGAKYIQASSKFKPPVFDGNKMPIDPAALYDGVWVRAWLRGYTYDASGNRGVGFGIVSLQKLRDDEAFPKSDPSRAFDEVQSHGGGSPAPAAAAAAPPANIPGF
jgi:hypothetical protein